jgi:DNA-binding transcriptional regulator YiaG
MTPTEFKAARAAAGLMTQQAAADALEIDRRTVGRWERGEVPVPGPARVALRLMLQTSPSTAANPGMPAA